KATRSRWSSSSASADGGLRRSSAGHRPAGARPPVVAQAPWQRLYFLPLPHQHGSLRPMSRCSLTTGLGVPLGVVSGGAASAGATPHPRRRTPARCGDRVGALQLLVLVRECLRRLHGLQLLLGLVALHLDVEERE